MITIGTLDTDGWTVLEPSTDTRTVYVSRKGSDSNDGLAPDRAVRSLARGYALVRDGYPDHMLLRRGDMFPYAPLYCTKSGRSASEPLVIGAYGEGARPVVMGGMPQMTAPSSRGVRCDYVAMVGLCFAGGSSKWLGPSKGILMEDCKSSASGMSFQSFYGRVADLTLRRCVVVDNYDATTGKAQGIYCDSVQGILIEECVFDHNGWLDGVADPTVFSHNIYISARCTDLVVRNNIIADPASHGLQARCGGVVEGNVFARCPIALSFGYVIGDSYVSGGVTGSIKGNVILEGIDIGRDGTVPRGFGMQLANLAPVGDTVVADNILANDASSQAYGYGIEANAGALGVGLHGLTVRDNTFYNWNTPLFVAGECGTRVTRLVVACNRFQNVNRTTPLVVHTHPVVREYASYFGNRYYGAGARDAWFRIVRQNLGPNEWEAVTAAPVCAAQMEYYDAARSLGGYHGALGRVPTFDGFMTEARQQSRGNWRPEYTAAAVVAYVRDGFSLVRRFGIGEAVDALRYGHAVTRQAWGDTPVVELQDGTLYTGGAAWVPTAGDVLATDWRRTDGL